MEKKNYIVRGVGYIALLSAIIEQANDDIKKYQKYTDTPAVRKEIKDIEAGIKEWADIAQSDINFNIYE